MSEKTFIWVDPKGATAIKPYLLSTIRHPEIFPPTLVPVTRVVLAYSSATQGTPLAIADMCIDNELEFTMLTVPDSAPGSSDAFLARLKERRSELKESDHVFIIKHAERNFIRGNYHSDPDFFRKLNAIMNRCASPVPMATCEGSHLAVVCLGMVPSELPRQSHCYVPIQCYFGPPTAEAREKLFLRFFTELREHLVPKHHARCIDWNLDNETFSMLADHSASRSVGEIREFVGKIFHSLLAFMFLRDNDKKLTINQEFVMKRLHEGTELNEADANVAEDQFRLYAGEAQSHHAAASTSVSVSPFASKSPQKRKRADQ